MKKKYRAKKRIRSSAGPLLVAVLLLLAVGIICNFERITGLINAGKVEDISAFSADVGALPDYSGSPYCTVNGNKAQFDSVLIDKARKGSFEDYSSLDKHGRCVGATICASRETMPGEGVSRGDISSVHPSGWKSGMGWERCHLIAWSIGAEDANDCNLITGTHYLNVEGMLPFEQKITSYINQTDKHVLYQVTPIYDGKNLIASGVHMQAWSVEDKGRGVNFNVYCYNVSPSVTIDYKTGVVVELDSEGKPMQYEERNYILNTNSHKFHYPSCKGAADISAHNRKEVKARRNDLIAQGYEPCGICEP